MSPSEQEQILVAFISQIAGQDDIDVKQIKAMLNIATLSNDLHHVLLRYLTQLQGSQIKLKHIPYFVDYAERNNCKEDILKIAKSKWDKNIVSGFEQQLYKE